MTVIERLDKLVISHPHCTKIPSRNRVNRNAKLEAFKDKELMMIQEFYSDQPSKKYSGKLVQKKSGDYIFEDKSGRNIMNITDFATHGQKYQTDRVTLV
jgi:hypothetical protein